MLSSQSDMSRFDVEFTNISFHGVTPLSPDNPVELSILIHTSGNFEVIDGQTLVATGTIKHRPNQTSTPKLLTQSKDMKTLSLNKEENYRELQLQGYKFSNVFGGLESFCYDSNSGKIQWQGHWDAFLDAIVQTFLVSRNTRTMHLTNAIRKIKINAVEHSNWVASVENSEMKLCAVSFCKETNTIVSGGIDRRQPTDCEVREDYQYVPLMDENNTYSLTDAVRICVQLAIEKSLPNHVTILEALGNNNAPIIEHFRDIVQITPLINGTFKLITDRPFQLDSIEIKQPKEMDQTKKTIVIWNTPNIDVTSIAELVSPRGFLIIVQNNQLVSNFEPPENFTLVSAVRSVDLALLMLHHNSDIPECKVISINSADAEFSWLKQVQDVQETENAILLADHDKTSGLLGFWKTVRMEPNMANYKCFIICDDDAPPFNVANPFYRAQLKLGLPLNILQNGKWGTYRFLALKPKRNETYSSVRIQASRPGDSQSLKWVPSINVVSEGATIEVQYIGLSRRDVMLATGRLSHESCVEQKVKQIGILGTEFAGIDANGQQVNGMRFDDEALAT